MTFKNSEKTREAMTSYIIASNLYYLFLKLIFALIVAAFAILILFIPGLERTDRYMAVLLFIVGPISGVLTYYLYTPIEDKMKSKKLETLYQTYVVF